MPRLLLLALVGLAASCHHAASPAPTAPALYDQLAQATGHWDWQSTARGSTSAPIQYPSTVGYTRQLVFAPNNQLVLRHNDQVSYLATYQLSRGNFTTCTYSYPAPIVSFTTNEVGALQNSDSVRYEVLHKKAALGELQLTLTGKTYCIGGDAIEVYRWVAE